MTPGFAKSRTWDIQSGRNLVIDLDRLQLGRAKPTDLGLGGARIWPLPSFEDRRGKIVPVELTRDLPFPAKRHFVVYGVSEQVRGEHAHRQCHQLIVALNGAFHLVLYDGESSIELVLRQPFLGIYIPPMIWAVQYKFSPNSIIGVYCSHPYDPDDYIRNLEEFKQNTNKQKLQGDQ
jgi:UDP-2-acetamido-3-amino-2,3-dideoxy-glucuronate N-acetyltransferase